MSAQVIHLASEDRVDAAWHEYAEEARKLVTNPQLLCDRDFNETLARKHKAWLQLFYIQEAER
jgi:hypothetical protein